MRNIVWAVRNKRLNAEERQFLSLPPSSSPFALHRLSFRASNVLNQTSLKEQAILDFFFSGDCSQNSKYMIQFIYSFCRKKQDISKSSLIVYYHNTIDLTELWYLHQARFCLLGFNSSLIYIVLSMRNYLAFQRVTAVCHSARLKSGWPFPCCGRKGFVS